MNWLCVVNDLMSEHLIAEIINRLDRCYYNDRLDHQHQMESSSSPAFLCCCIKKKLKFYLYSIINDTGSVSLYQTVVWYDLVSCIG